MLYPWNQDNQILSEARFRQDEVPYNLIHLLTGVPSAHCFKSEEIPIRCTGTSVLLNMGKLRRSSFNHDAVMAKRP